MNISVESPRVPSQQTLILTLVLAFSWTVAAQADDTTTAGVATAEARSSGWITASAPLTGDDNRNGWSEFELGTDPAGPFSPSDALYHLLPGTGEWRVDAFWRGGVAPSTTYYVRVTYFDPDGVVGTNPQVIGPIVTPAASPDAVTAGTATAEARDDEIFVSVPISDDADRSSYASVDIATDPGGPWTRKCGGTGAEVPFQPKRCRLRSLTPGTDYWIQVTVIDEDGVAGTNPQILGPVRYEGLENLALGASISADPGWGCCPNPAELVNGRVQHDDWTHGFAWTGGTNGWGGGSAGFKQATVDFGVPTTMNRAVVWYHNANSVPRVWSFQTSDDGVSWTDAFTTDQPMCRALDFYVSVGWGIPSCAHDATFPEVTARYLRYEFDDRTLFDGMHGWAQEIEVFHAVAPPGGFVVVNTADSGPGSLRQAILDANADQSVPHTISFAIPTSDAGFDGSVFTIQPLTELPIVRRSTTIDGLSQAGLTGDTNPLGPEIVLNGALQASGSGLRLDDDNVVRYLVVNGFPSTGIGMSYGTSADLRADRNRIESCYIGTDPTGTSAVPNVVGLSIHGFASPGVQATGNVFADNVISGNLDSAIILCDAAETQILGNRIGTDRTGLLPLGNGAMGVRITCAGAPRNLLQGNVIAYSVEDGVHDAPDYRYAVAYTANGHQGNAVRGNSIHSNGGLGINLLPPPFPPTEPPSTATPNDSCDTDTGGNLLQNFPEITGAITDGVSTTTIDGFLDGRPNDSFEIELFANDAGDASGYGEGQTWLATVPVTTDGTCLASFSVPLAVALPVGSIVTATATDASGNTSELSPGLAVVCTDDDGDGVCDVDDICPGYDDELDADADGVPDGCDLCQGDDASGDGDSDGVCDDLDACPGYDDELDADGDGVPDGCDLCQGDDAPGDGDTDGVCDDLDACPGYDDASDADVDGVPDGCDNCWVVTNPGQEDADFDSVGDACDNCPDDPNVDQLDEDVDGVGNACDICLGDDTTGDVDGDGLCADRDCDDTDPSNACEIFADGFESGDLTAWSGSVGP